MNKQSKDNPIFDELKRDYRKAKEKHDFVAMREIYIELWIRDREMPFFYKGREEVVFFAEISDDNSVALPHELSEFFGKKCYISLSDDRINISDDCENAIIEDYMKSVCLEFKKIVLQNRFEFSPYALSVLKVKSGDIIRIELNIDLVGMELNIYNEADNSRFGLAEVYEI